MTEGRLRNHHLDQTAAFGSFEPAQVSPRLKRRSTTGGVPNRPARAVLFSRGTGNADIRDVHAMCCDACPCKNGGKAVCCEHCSLKDENRHKKRADRGEVKDTACNTDWEGEGVTKGGLSNAVKMRRKRPRNSS
ncbi:hypothetical protein Pmar_PMAR016168 [Perkinsus marinus ATCC 50983]|uniref:Uncharacterized protein n=1 Tax=Perkinsus marinus (strain ATCC 50983 / TXsc) TaxID=423536 RepID=C5KVM3_PERM5|nr:hypothetical protein Pmar_PMAR016168 [Perkinsus marinus ATCC 50983]EER11470.1 hypothetical protein Pmar_PMAR016168 [Perkinsus marinus ATCC 50983]|eukprot:XP_002779675.1 hypothetical protein Pmar_PMAR016168 [Perkinsus marinus ATCC 50983]